MAERVFSLALTILIEFSVFWFFVRKNKPVLFLYTVLINSFTLPLAEYFYRSALFSFFKIEAGVIFAESFLLMGLLRIKYLKALLISLVANFTTAMVSLLFFSDKAVSDFFQKLIKL